MTYGISYTEEDLDRMLEKPASKIRPKIQTAKDTESGCFTLAFSAALLGGTLLLGYGMRPVLKEMQARENYVNQAMQSADKNKNGIVENTELYALGKRLGVVKQKEILTARELEERVKSAIANNYDRVNGNQPLYHAERHE